MSVKTKRRLAAIVSVDVVGYSRLMGEDESGTLAALRQFRAGLFEPTISEHRGNIVKSMGDGWLVAFDSAADAVSCAVETQEKLSGHDVLKVRIGLHIGDVIPSGDD
jgi:class 3 adenylate cyclase